MPDDAPNGEASGPPSLDDLPASALHHEARRTLIGAGLAVGVVALAIGVLGGVSSYEGRQLLSASLSTVRFMCSAVMTASATTLALMLTILSLSSQVDGQLKPIHFLRIRLIALLDTIVFIGATVLLLMLGIPVEEADSVPPTWFKVVYYFVLGSSALLGGGLMAVVLMIYGAVRDFIRLVGPWDSEDLIRGEPEDAREQAEPAGA